jgi:putative zinc finger/helix-turn-helix YgiT family protein
MNKTTECFDCDSGHYLPETTEYVLATQDGGKITIPDLTVLRCSNCGREMIPSDSLKRISAALSAEPDQFTRKQLYRFLEQFNLSQAEAAEITGLGAKTISRWLRGTQVISRSMGYYLRVLMAFPEALEWVRSRRWRRIDALAADQAVGETMPLRFNQFPALEKRNDWHPAVHGNPAAGLLYVVPATTEECTLS